MIFAERSEQRSFPEYVDMEFKDLVVREEYTEMKGWPILNWRELLDLLKEGFFPGFCDIPKYLPEDAYVEGVGDGKWIRFAKEIFNKYGESAKAKRTDIMLNKKCQEMSEEEMMISCFPIVDESDCELPF